MLARRAGEANPAFSVAHQLLAIFGFLTLTMPRPTVELKPMIDFDSKDQLSRKLGVAKRYLDIFLKSGSVPYSLLLAHVRGAATRRDALSELRKRIPAEALDWLSEIERQHDWSSLTLCFSHEGDDQIEINILKAVSRWEKGKRSDDATPVVADVTNIEGTDGGDDGDGAPPPVRKPDTDPSKPKP